MAQLWRSLGGNDGPTMTNAIFILTQILLKFDLEYQLISYYLLSNWEQHFLVGRPFQFALVPFESAAASGDRR